MIKAASAVRIAAAGTGPSQPLNRVNQSVKIVPASAAAKSAEPTPYATYVRLKELATETPTPTTAAFVAAAMAYATDNARQLTDAAGALRDLGHLLPAAEAAATAYRLHVRAGRRTAAKNTLALARELLAECGRARTPLTDLTGSEVSLTPRELQVAKLVAAGLSGRAVADRLGLSLRTVNNHLGRIYVKLGVSGRQALADALGQPYECTPCSAGQRAVYRSVNGNPMI